MNFTRRSFLQTTGAAALGFPALVRGQNLNSTLQIVAVGASGKGWSDISEIGSHPKAQYVAFADVDTARFTKAVQKYPEAQQFQDFREMFAKLADKFDAVSVSTPDHMHAFAGLTAMRLKKHLYSQKPLTHTVWEARQMRLQAAKSGVTTQMGNQIHSHTAYRTAVKAIQSGAIGKIEEVHSWQNKTGNAYTKLTGEIPPSGPVPETLNWDLWIGPAPMRDFAPNAYVPEKWRDWQDFGGGVMGDFGCHILDPVFTALQLTAPLHLTAENSGLNPQTWPEAESVSYLFPGSAWTTGKTMPLTWHDGGRKLPEELVARLPAEKKLPAAGSIFIGEAGLLLLPHVGDPEVFLKDGETSPEIEKVAGVSHYHAWVDAALGGLKTTDGFDYAGPLTEAVVLGMIATRFPGALLEWDPAGMRFPNKPEAEKLLTREYREGWNIEAVA